MSSSVSGTPSLRAPACSSVFIPRFALSLLTLACASATAQTAAPTLPIVSVTATRFPEDASTLPFGVSVITAEQIKDAGVTTVSEALTKLLGIPGRLDLGGGGDYSLDLRGFGSTADLNQAVVVDGVRVNEGDLGGTRLAGIPIDAIERIEVVRGSAGVLYGAGATAGAIVVTTKAAATRARVSSAYGYGGFGSNNLIDTRAGASLAGENLSLDVHGNMRSTDGHRDNFASNVEGLFVNAQWRNDWLRVGVRDSQDKLNSRLPGSLTAAQYADNPRQTSTPDDKVDVDNHSTHGYAEAALGAWSVGADVGVRNKTVLSVSQFGLYGYDIESRNQNLHVRHSAPIGPVKNTLVAGVDREAWTRTVRGAFGPTGNRDVKDFYLTDDLAFGSGTRLNAGVRRSKFTTDSTGAPGADVDETFTSWNLGVVQSLGRSVDVYANVGRSVRFANVDEIGFVPVGVTLKPQVSRDIDAGARLDWANGRGQLRLYRNAIRDEIGYDPVVTGPYGYPGANVNLPETVHQGVELELTQSVASSVSLRLNAALRRAEFTAGPNDGKDIALTPQHTVSFGVDWKPFTGQLLNAQLNTVGKQSPDFANQCSMPAYTTLDLRYAFKLADAQLALGVTNVTDKKYYTQAFSCSAAGETNSIYPEAGRGVVASVRVAF